MFAKLKGMAEGVINAFTTQNDSPIYKEDLISFVNEQFKERQNDKLPLELQWRLNMDFNNGNQHRIINVHSNTIEERAFMFDHEVRKTYNQMSPIIETRLSKLARVPHALKVRPATSDQDDISSAKVSTKILESTTKDQKFEKLHLKANLWAEVAGTAVWKISWDKNAGQELGQMEGQNYCEGDIQTDVCSPFEIFPDSVFNEPDEVRSLIHAKAYHKNEIMERWNVEVQGEKVNVFTLKKSAGGLTQGRNNGMSIEASTKKESALVLEYWELPTKQYPKGRLVICTESVLLYTGDLPYTNDEGKPYLPFFPQKCILINNCYFGKAIVERLIPIQEEYNALKNRKGEYLRRCAIGIVVYEEGSLDEDLVMTEGFAPGAMIPYGRGHQPPQFMNNLQLPSTFETEEQKLLNDFNRISGVSEVSRDSSTPTGVSSGTALSLLQEQDDTRLSLTAKHVQNAVTEIGQTILYLYKQFVEFPRTLRNVGKNNLVEVMDWEANDLTSFDVYIEGASQLSDTPAQRRQMVFDLLGTGLFNDPETGQISKEGKLKIFEMLQMGNWEDFDEGNNLHNEKAQRENRLMIQGQMPQVREFDDHMIHISKHNQYRLTNDYEEKLAENPQIDQIFEAHLQQHFMMLQQSLPTPPMEGEEQIEKPMQ
ncbi:portal protein [Marinisporobacter balticus]|uniref:SPP1 Gp6-like portal protein n=1 Tax=Marinisporobacter balticus TaxID=2018667 RepID=A0A4R2L1Q8_9FIRM|nr:hypothetical protein [Marinisporobacter balticus]TCO79127.1 hypothetical protein EV214_103179 [Marinisporobacter balticus]